MDDRARKKNAGFTLVESVVAVLILALGLGASALTFNMAMRSVATNRNQMSALHYAREQIEFLRTLNWSDPALSPGTYNISTPDYSGFYAVSPGGTDVRNVTVSINLVNEMANPTAPGTNGLSQAVLTTAITRVLHE